MILKFCPLFFIVNLSSGYDVPISSCLDQSNIVIENNVLDVDPLPINFPGDVSVGAVIRLANDSFAQNLLNYKVDFEVQRHLPIVGGVSVPCVNGFGSCTQTMEEFLAKGGATITDALEHGETKLDIGKIIHHKCLPSLSGLTSMFTSGEYEAEIRIIDEDDNEIACFQVTEVKVTTDGDGECSEDSLGTSEKRKNLSESAVSVDSCMDDGAVLKLTASEVLLKPFPINFPGPVTASIGIEIGNEQKAALVANSKVELKLKRHIPVLTDVLQQTIDIPCIGTFGSCSKPLKEYFPELANALLEGKTEFSLSDYFTDRCLPNLGLIGQKLAAGTYDLQVKLKSTEPDEVVLACFQLQIEIDTQDGFSCGIKDNSSEQTEEESDNSSEEKESAEDVEELKEEIHELEEELEEKKHEIGGEAKAAGNDHISVVIVALSVFSILIQATGTGCFININ